jgi:hypothetical protein
MIKKISIIVFLVIILVAFAARALLYSQGLTVTSWYRTPWKNASVEGKMFSLHLIGWAFDIIPVNKAIHDTLAIWPFKFVVESDHIHLQIF